MRSLIGGKRLGRLAAVCLAALFSWLIAADAAGAYGVRVDALSADGSKLVDSVELDLAALRGSEDVRGREYTVRYASGMVETERITGFSLLEILEQAEAAKLDIDPQDFRLVTIASQGGSYTVGQAEAGGDENGRPVIFEDGAETAFLRPSKGATDRNGEDRLVGPTLLLEVRPRPPQPEVGIAATVLRDGEQVPLKTGEPPVEVDVGDRVTLVGSVEDGPAGKLDYSWSFGDDRSRETGERVSHVFERRGSHRVVLEVVGRAGRPVKGQIEFQVGDGPEGEGTLESSESPPDDAATGGYDYDYGSGGYDYGTGSYDYGSGGGYDYGGGSGASSPTPPPAPASGSKPPRGEATEILDPPGRQVSGELLRDPATFIPPAAEAVATAAPASTDGSAGEDGMGVPGAAVASLAVLALLGVGAAGELGRLHPANLGLLRLRELLGR